MAERLNKVIATSGLVARRKADELIAAGRVVVNGTRAALGARVNPGDSTLVDGQPLPRHERVTYAVYKPTGVVCSAVSQRGEKIVTELVPAVPPVVPVGRLDKESEGLILLTNDGALTDRLTHPRYGHEKEYEVWGTCAGEPAAALQKLTRGVKLGDGKAQALTASLLESKGGILKARITVHEGRHHLVRRMCATVGITVTRLIRTRVSSLALPNLSPGSYQLLTEKELALLQ